MTTKKKTFDCVRMKRRGAEQVYQTIKDMTPDEEAAYWRDRTNDLRQEQSHLRISEKTNGK